MNNSANWFVRYWWIFPIISMVFIYLSCITVSFVLLSFLTILVTFLSLVFQLAILIMSIKENLKDKKWWRSVLILLAGLISCNIFVGLLVWSSLRMVS